MKTIFSHRTLRHRLPSAFLLGLFLSAPLLAVGVRERQVLGAEPEYLVFLPAINREGTPDPSPGPDPEPEPSPVVEGAVMFGFDSFRGASIAVDGQDRMHVAFSRVAPLLGDKKPAVLYGFCDPALLDCGSAANWQLAEVDTLSQGWSWVQLELTPSGQPRLMLMRSVFREGVIAGGLLYRYAECNSNCTNAQNWSSLDITDQGTGAGLDNHYFNYQTFALDHLGRPRFVYEDRVNWEQHYGAFYVYCDANCTQLDNWFETRIDAHGDNVYIDEQAVLVFSADGRPRLFGQDGGTIEDPSSKLVYVACEGNCTNAANWSLPLRLLTISSGGLYHGWSPALTQDGGVRLSFYPIGGPFHYLWCDGDCTQPDSWGGYSLDLGQGGGKYSSLALDSQARPHLAFHTDTYDLGYLWCSAGCETDTPQWDAVLAEDSDQIAAENPVKPLPTCTRGSWYGGFRPTLVLDSQDNPRIGYDGEYLMECYRNPGDPNDKTTYIETKWWTSRFVFFPKP